MMLINNLKIALRALRKNKIYAFVTIVGLTVGVAAALLIFRMVKYELSFNKSFPKHERIVRVVADVTDSDGDVNPSVCTPIPAMDIIEQTVSQFDEMSRVKEFWATIAQPDPNGGPPLQKYNMDEGATAFFVEPEFIKVFDLTILAGDPVTALAEPNVIILTEHWANKLFGGLEAAMGESLVMDNVVPVTVRGVIADLPVNTDFPLPFLSSWETLKAHPDHFFYDDEWGSCSSNNQVFALLNNPEQMDAANGVLARVGAEEYKDRNGDKRRTHVVQPLADLHYNEDLGHSGTHQISKSRLRILSGIGILILIMACFNFINLATAQASLRAREVGVRKTLGSTKGQLIGQFMSETGFIVFVSMGLGLSLAYLCLPFLQHISDVPEAEPFLANFSVWAFIISIAIVVTLLAGLYPSLVLSGFGPVQALKNEIHRKASGRAGLRKALVVAQFAIAQALVVGAIITLLQLDYIRSRDLGFSQDLVYTFGVNVDSSSIDRQSVLKQQLLQIPSVEKVSFSNDQPLSGNTWMQNFRYASRPEDEPYGITLRFCDEDYQDTYGLELLAGRWFGPSDTIRQGVVNMTTLEKLAVYDAQEAVGQTLYLGGGRPVEIVGVVENFHTHSLHREHMPLLLTTRNEFYWEVGVKMRPNDISGTLASIRQKYDAVMPEQVFEGTFLDERIADFYEDENRLSAVCKGFGLLAILISCLGLFGLAAHAAQRRVKEIGVRKVLGASVGGLVGLLSRDFLKLVFIALLIAGPLAYYFMNSWLQDFAYRIDIEWWVFALAGVLALLVAFLTVGFRSLRAALANPVEALRSE